jgi:hypothetical protein
MAIIQLNTSTAGYTYSESDTKADRTADGVAVVKGQRGLNSGQYYWEWDITGDGVESILATHGLINAAGATSTTPGLVGTNGWSANIGPSGRDGLAGGNGYWYNTGAYANGTGAF